MSGFLRFFLPVYFIAFLGTAIVWRSYLVWKATGHNPYKLAKGDTAHDYLGAWFRGAVIAIAGMITVYLFLPSVYRYLLPVFWMESPALALAGVLLLVVALVWILIAQSNMGRSWRIGVDQDARTELVQQGLFTISRNPIFLGMRVMLLGLFLVLPNAVSFAILLLGEALIQTQVRLEEEHLLKLHGDVYRTYRNRTRRWI